MQNQFLPSETTAETTPHVAPPVMSETADTTETLASTLTVTELLAQAQWKVHRRKTKYWGAFILLEVLLISPVVWAVQRLGVENLPSDSTSLLLFLVPPFCALSMMFLAAFTSAHLDTDTLARMGGPKAIPILLDSLAANASHKHRKAVFSALTVLLPQMQASDVSLLTPQHRYMLNMLLGQSHLPTWLAGAEYALALAILKAYEQVGDAKAIPIVKRLADSKPRNERQRKIQAAAEDCLPLLQAHVGGMDVAHSLLRASMPDTNAPKILLRAATADTSTNRDELLRAANVNDATPFP